MFKPIKALLMLSLLVVIGGCAKSPEAIKQESTLKQLTRTNNSKQAQLETLLSQNRATKKAISSYKEEQVSQRTAMQSSSVAKPPVDQDFAGQQELVLNNDNPDFTEDDLSTAKGAWEQYADLDKQNRATKAEALLNQSLMPTAKREALTWTPTGWHNKKTPHGWLYNRSHLIGYQLSGENNNPKNLITGTQSLNNPLMLAHEMDIATYLKADNKRYVRYTVTPIYRGEELLARGVQLRAQSVGDDQIRFNVYIFNVEPGYKLNYADGTSSKA